MIIRGEWRRYWRLLWEKRQELTKTEFYKAMGTLIAVIPLCALYWTIYTLSEGFDAAGTWMSDKLVDAGCWIHDKTWRRK